MAFENISDQLKESVNTLKSRVTESELYNRFREFYYTLPTRQQTLLKVGAVLVVLFVAVNIPLQRLKESTYNMNHYSERKDIIRRIKTIEKQKASLSFSPEMFNFSRFTSEAEGRLMSVPVTREQIKIQPAQPVQNLFPAQAHVETFEVNLNKLNVRQLAHSMRVLENMNDSLIVTGVRTQADSEDPHYHNVKLYITNFAVPETAPVETPPAGRSSRGRGRN
ncbi:MAG: hypothetical protein M9899_06870 [Bdellovibrionaceae bacterium]|nr:hypothetical protein [Pseudobdellovibrionaceae bacterium]